MHDHCRLIGRLSLVLRGPDGRIKARRVAHNTITTYGKNGAADLMLASPTVVKPGWMATGTSTPASTLLGAEVARVAFTSKTRSNAIVTMVGDFAAGVGTGTIIEAGLFDVVTANTVNMWASTTFAAIGKGASDSLSLTWTWTQA